MRATLEGGGGLADGGDNHLEQTLGEKDKRFLLPAILCLQLKGSPVGEGGREGGRRGGEGGRNEHLYLPQGDYRLLWVPNEFMLPKLPWVHNGMETGDRIVQGLQDAPSAMTHCNHSTDMETTHSHLL